MLTLICTIIFSGIKLIQSGDMKEKTLGAYNTVISKMGDEVLTSKQKLVGNRTFGVDHYVGTYTATYKNKTGTECIFGGSILERKNGSTIHTKITIENSEGTIEIRVKQKEKEQTIATEDGTYEYDFDVQYGSNYLSIYLQNYSGRVTIESK